MIFLFSIEKLFIIDINYDINLLCYNDKMYKIKLLIVEDDQMQQQKLKESIERSCFQDIFEISMGNNGKEGLDIALKIKPHIVITDYIMPELNGLSMIEKINQNKLLKKTKILLMSSYGIDIKETKVFKFLLKPYWFRDLQEIINNFLIDVRENM